MKTGDYSIRSMKGAPKLSPKPMIPISTVGRISRTKPDLSTFDARKDKPTEDPRSASHQQVDQYLGAASATPSARRVVTRRQVVGHEAKAELSSG